MNLKMSSFDHCSSHTNCGTENFTLRAPRQQKTNTIPKCIETWTRLAWRVDCKPRVAATVARAESLWESWKTRFCGDPTSLAPPITSRARPDTRRVWIRLFVSYVSYDVKRTTRRLIRALDKHVTHRSKFILDRYVAGKVICHLVWELAVRYRDHRRRRRTICSLSCDRSIASSKTISQDSVL
jgi:hypothetical protein